MSIKYACPSCGKVFLLPDAVAGKRARCAACRAIFGVPQGTVAPRPGQDGSAKEPPPGRTSSAGMAGPSSLFDFPSQPAKPPQRKAGGLRWLPAVMGCAGLLFLLIAASGAAWFFGVPSSLTGTDTAAVNPANNKRQDIAGESKEKINKAGDSPEKKLSEKKAPEREVPSKKPAEKEPVEKEPLHQEITDKKPSKNQPAEDKPAEKEAQEDPAPSPPTGPTVTLTLDHPQTAGISAFRSFWDAPVVLSENGATEIKDQKVKDKWATAVWSPQKRKGGQPGALAFDALHRSALVRFPDAAEKIYAQMRKGYAVQKVELVLPFKDTELWPVGDTSGLASPEGYIYRSNFGVEDYWKHTPPRWHAVAWALRKPWSASDETGPTYNAYINGAGYWAKYGAQDEKQDRYAKRFGPSEVSYKQTQGHMDVTATLTDPAFGKTLAERLRMMADNGFLLKKWELYDHRYYHEVYEWATNTGGRAIMLHTPRMVVTFRPSASPEALPVLAPPTDVAALARKLNETKSGGEPTAVLPSKEQLDKWAAGTTTRPEWMPEWQWANVQQLTLLSSTEKTKEKKARPFWYDLVGESMLQHRVGRLVRTTSGVVRVVTPEEAYAGWVDTILSRQPRGWMGFLAASDMMQWYLFHHALPGPARDHFRTIWEAWLMPDRPTKDFEHPMADQLAKKPFRDKDFVDSYYARTEDWRGNKSFYRDGFCYVQSTQNYNVTASTGALLGGALIDSKYAMADGRNGVENFLLRQWAWMDGASQECIDHYYYPITLSGQKVIADFGPTRFDRLMGESMLTKSMEEVLSTYHPNLRRFIAGSNRTSLEYLLATQDGLQFIMHTLAPGGALHDLDKPDIPGKMPVLGHEVPPERIAQLALVHPWAPEWSANKTLPHQDVSHRWGGAWQCIYQGQHYGLASVSQGSPRVQAMAQWRRRANPVERLEDIVTMDVRYGINNTGWVNNAPGWIAPMGQQAVLQHKNKMLVVANPWIADWLKERIAKEGLQSLQTSLALFNSQSKPTWEIYVDDKKVTSFPFKAKQGQHITIKDGVTYLGVIPLPATDLGRTDEVVLREGDEQTYQKMKYRPALVIDSFNLQRGRTKTPPTADDYAKWQKSAGGFVVELGDAAEYGSFEAFQQHLKNAKLKTAWADAARTRLRVSYSSGNDTLTGVFEAAAATRCLSGCTVNGKDAYLSKGILRDTTFSQQGNSGELKKDGAVLKTDTGVMTYLRTDTVSGTYLALNALPVPTAWSFTVPGDVTIRAEGRLGLAKIIVRPKESKVSVDYARKEGQDDLAKSLRIAGLGGEPQVIRNGKAVTDKLATKTENGKTVYIIPLP